MIAVAEKTFKDLRQLADEHNDVDFIAVSHSDEQSTDKWVISVGGHRETKVIVDSDREIYAQWGLGVSSAWHVLNPWSLWNVFSLGNKEQIWNRPTESGSRWQTAGSFAIDKDGIVEWARGSSSFHIVFSCFSVRSKSKKICFGRLVQFICLKPCFLLCVVLPSMQQD